jgi:hypothetical protein
VVPFLLAVVVIAAGAALLGFIVTNRVTDGGGSGGPVSLEALADFDPEGGDGEHPETVPAATDGDVNTAWSTETYNSFSKSGVGIVLDAGRSVDLDRIEVITDQPGFTALIRAGDRPGGGFADVSEEQTVNSRTVFRLEGSEEHRYYVVWITDPNGRADLNEVRAD